MLCFSSNAKCIRLRWMLMVKENSSNFAGANRPFEWISFVKNIVFSRAMTTKFACEWLIVMATWYIIRSSITVLKWKHDRHFHLFIVIVFHFPDKYCSRETCILRNSNENNDSDGYGANSILCINLFLYHTYHIFIKELG